MIINIRYYVLTVTSIFLALGIGIFIGFMFDAQEIIMSQKKDIVSQLEERFNYLKDENEGLKSEINDLTIKNRQYKDFSEIIFSELIQDRLDGVKVAIIETNDDYIYSNISKILEVAGADVISLTTVKDSFIAQEDSLKEMFEQENSSSNGYTVSSIIEDLTRSIVTGKDNEIIYFLEERDMIDAIGNYNIATDYIIIAGGSNKKEGDKTEKIDNIIIEYCKKANIPIVGIEKESVEYSYIDVYKQGRISTVDNADSVIGQVSLVMTMGGISGNYGVKPSAESFMPDINNKVDF